ncbi:MAG: CHAP domain-containing protein [Pseudomonadales bacterium]|jgi:cell wall-associated NlpC family hydrolase|nr:CHAP domain-containing protein [Pseudomonadales bacterium]
MSFDIDEAVSYARLHAKPQSIKRCAEFTRKAIKGGGVDLNRTESAKNYGPSLEQAGFIRVYDSPQKGDVVIIQPYQGVTGSSVHGHMAIYDGFKWISDFAQNDIYPGQSYKQHKPPYQIYRYQEQ